MKGKRKFARGIKLYMALMVLPNKAEPKKYTQIPGDGKWKWDYSQISEVGYADLDAEKPCGTIGCMLGMAAALGIMEDPVSSTASGVLAQELGLDRQELYDLAYGGAFPQKSMSEVTPRQVAKRLKKLLAAAYPEHMKAWEEAGA